MGAAASQDRLTRESFPAATIGVPKETHPRERRVAITPAVVPSLTRAGLTVLIEAGAGAEAGFGDEAYRDKGARIVDRSQAFAADVLLWVRALGSPSAVADLEALHPGQVVIGMLDPLFNPEACRDLADREVVAFALELLPRTTRAQSMDVLSSQATVAGYKAVLLAADALPKLFPLMTTAAGTLAPARALVVGTGVAGLQAIATARRLGAVVEAYDLRPAAREEVESLGARFVELPLASDDAEDTGGYAKAQGDDFYRRQRELLDRVVASSDVVITTALIPGRRAPLLITAAMVAGMSPGSVVVDLAAEHGGNCELSRPDELTVQGGVRVFAPTDLPSTVAHHASQMYAKNIVSFLLHLQKGGQVRVPPDDEIGAETLVCRDGAIVHPRVVEALRALAGTHAGGGEV
jgi:proton-translocating NAD(P)+ transhydrogenase subunit alpha